MAKTVTEISVYWTKLQGVEAKEMRAQSAELRALSQQLLSDLQLLSSLPDLILFLKQVIESRITFSKRGVMEN